MLNRVDLMGHPETQKIMSDIFMCPAVPSACALSVSQNVWDNTCINFQKAKYKNGSAWLYKHKECRECKGSRKPAGLKIISVKQENELKKEVEARMGGNKGVCRVCEETRELKPSNLCSTCHIITVAARNRPHSLITALNIEGVHIPTLLSQDDKEAVLVQFDGSEEAKTIKRLREELDQAKTYIEKYQTDLARYVKENQDLKKRLAAERPSDTVRAAENALWEMAMRHVSKEERDSLNIIKRGINAGT